MGEGCSSIHLLCSLENNLEATKSRSRRLAKLDLQNLWLSLGPQDLVPGLPLCPHQNNQSQTVDPTPARRETEVWKSKLAHNKVGSYSVLAKSCPALLQCVKLLNLKSHQGSRVGYRGRPCGCLGKRVEAEYRNGEGWAGEKRLFLRNLTLLN